MSEYTDLQIKHQVSPSSALEHILHAMFLLMDLLYLQFARQISVIDLHNGHHSAI